MVSKQWEGNGEATISSIVVSTGEGVNKSFDPSLFYAWSTSRKPPPKSHHYRSMKNLAFTAIIFASLCGPQVMALPIVDATAHPQSQDAELPPWLGAYLAGELNTAYNAANNHGHGSSGGTVTVTPPSGGVNVGGDGGHPGSITVTGENGTENFGSGSDGNGGSITVTAPHH